jgi:NAD(P)-dependent dehydrogenase (short-subunit alcohol dehydrogenase family)
VPTSADVTAIASLNTWHPFGAWPVPQTGVVGTYGRLDCACNNAGIEGKVDRVMSVNAKGIFLCLKYEIAQRLKNGGGAIVNLASVAGLIGFPGLGPYVASKHAINGLTKNAALEYSKHGVRVNSICPGGIEMRMLDSLVSQAGGGKVGTREMMDPRRDRPHAHRLSREHPCVA